MKQFFILVFFIGCLSIQGQFKTVNGGFGGRGPNRNLDSLSNNEISVKLSGKTKFTDYKIINLKKRDTSYVDTTLTIQKEYKHNFRRKDNFELLPFHNQGQTFNTLGYNFRSISQFPDIGFTAKQFNYLNIDDIDYYRVPTPTTEIMYKTGQEQGQVLDALFTFNLSKRLNVSLAYRGLRSLGQYRRSLSSTGNFRATMTYSTPKDQYNVRTHLTTQDFTNEESGGLTAESLQNFIANDPNFTDRGRLDVNLIDAESTLDGTRFYLDHNFKLFDSKDSTNTKNFSNLKVGHLLHYEKKFFTFEQASISTSLFGEASKTSGELRESTDYRLINNQGYLEFNSKYVLGKFRVKANYTTVNYGYDTIYNSNTNLISKKRLNGDAISLGADWNGRVGNFKVNANALVTPGSGYLAGNHFSGEAIYEKDSVFKVKGSLLLTSKAPNFNQQFSQSVYNKYNWENNFTNVDTRNIGFSFKSKWGNASLDFTNIEDYVYFGTDSLPKQFNGSITYLKVKANKEFKFLKKFALDNTVMYQNVSSGSDVFRVPEFVTRNTLYYTDHWFKGNPLQVQIGATFKYFTTYKANAYNPLLGEFILQNDTEIGFPTLDVFFNAKVRRTRIFFKIDNISSNFLEKNYFSAPNYPYRDMSIRFGVVWNWFI